MFTCKHVYIYVYEMKTGQDAASLPTIRPSAIPRAAPQEAAKVHQEPAVPKEPPPEPEFICDPPSISAFDLYE